MNAYRVGLTGGIGSGKSAVAHCFETLGITVLDADLIARQLITPGNSLFDPHLLGAIFSRFQSVCPHLQQADQSLNRRVLREWIFSHPEDKMWLENLLHPPIRDRLMQDATTINSPYLIWMVPLLVENPWFEKKLQRILVVEAPLEIQISRVMARDHLPREMVLKILASQADPALRRQKAHDLLINDGSLESLHLKVEKLHNQYLSYIGSGR